MRHSIIGFGEFGQALARAFARKNMEVTVASRRAPEALAPMAHAIGPTVIPVSLRDAVDSDTLFLAVPFWEHRAVAKTLPNWRGKTLIDVTNAFGIPVEDLSGLASSSVIAKAFPGAAFVKGFNHLPAAALGADPNIKGGRQVVFLSGDDEGAAPPVKALAEQLGFAPIWLGKLNEGGSLVQARGRSWAPLIFQDLIKSE